MVVHYCDSCGSEISDPKRLLKVEPGLGHSIKEPAWLCNFCAGSGAGNVFLYPSLQRSPGEAMTAVAQMMNILYESLKENQA